MEKWSQARSRLMRLAGIFISIAAVLALALCLNVLGNFFQHRDRFSSGIRNYDRETARKELSDLAYYRSMFQRWRLGRAADRFLFPKTYLYEASLNILAEDYEKVIDSLESKKDDHLASYMLGIAKYRIFQAEYQNTKNKNRRNEIMKKVVENVRPDFENAVRIGPGPAQAFDYSFDYDLLSDGKALRQALGQPKPKPQFVLDTNDGKKKCRCSATSRHTTSSPLLTSRASMMSR